MNLLRHAELHVLAEFLAGLTDGLSGEDGPLLAAPTQLCHMGFDMGRTTRENIEDPQDNDDFMGLEVEPFSEMIRTFAVAVIEGLTCQQKDDRCPPDARELTESD